MKAPTVKRTCVTTHGNSGNLLPNCAFTAPAIASCVHCQLTNASLGDVIIGYTMNAAYTSFEEDVRGYTEVGKFADIIILSDNLFEMRADDIEKVNPSRRLFVGMRSVASADSRGEHARMCHAEARWPIRQSSFLRSCAVA